MSVFTEKLSGLYQKNIHKVPKHFEIHGITFMVQANQKPQKF